MRLVWVERITIALSALALAVFLIALVSGYFSGRDVGPVAGGPGIGRTVRDQGDQLLAAGELRPPYDSNPPTSGPHVPVAIEHDETELSDNQILQALAEGDVVFVYGSRRPSRQLASLAGRLAGRFTPSLAASGYAVVLARSPGATGITALAWTRILRLRRFNSELLDEFTHDWLGRGAEGSSR